MHSCVIILKHHYGILERLRNILLVIAFFCVNALFSQQDTLFSLSFEDPAITPEAAGSSTVKSLATTYGDIKFLDLSFHNDDKTYHQIEIFGWIEFRTGSETINSTNSYVEIPPLNFVNGGNFYINYGAGSINRQLRLQEWDGSVWVNGAYEEVTILESSTWFQQNWEITGAGTKIFRLVMSSAAPMNVTDIVVTGDNGTIEVDCGDELSFGQANINLNESVVKEINISGTGLVSSISVDPTLPYRVSTTQEGTYYSSVTISPSGGSVYVKYEPSAVELNISTLTLSSPGVLSKVITLSGEGVSLSSEKSINFFSIVGYDAVVNELDKTINLSVPSNFDFADSYVPSITVSLTATLLTTQEFFFEPGVPVEYQVQAEDGSVASYQVVINQLSGDNQISVFTLEGYEGDINQDNKTIVVTIPSDIDLSIAYTPSIMVSAAATVLTTGSQFFSTDSPVTYNIKAEDGHLSSYKVFIVQLSGENQILSFSINGNVGVIDETTKSILVVLPAEMNSSLAYTPNVSVSTNATLLTLAPQVFSEDSSVEYSVESEDGRVANYVVTIDQLSDKKQITSFMLDGFVGGVDEVTKTILVTIPSSVDLSSAHIPTVIISDDATLLTSGLQFFSTVSPVIYTVQAEDGSVSSYEVSIIQLSGDNQILSFILDGYVGEINEVSKTIIVTVNSNFDFSIAYTPSLTISDDAAIITAGARMFSTLLTQTYMLQAEDGSISSYEVSIVQLSGENDITSFILDGSVGLINNVDNTITVALASSTDLAVPHTPSISVSLNATLITTGALFFEEGTPTVYTVVSEDGSLRDYQVNVKQSSNKSEITTFELIGVEGIINHVDKTVLLPLPTNTNLSISYIPVVTVSEGATLLTTGPKLFTKGVSVSFRVQAEDGSISDYDVTVSLSVDNNISLIEEAVVYSHNKRIIIRTDKNVDYYLYALNGTLISQSRTIEGSLSKSIKLENGVYIVIINGKSYKVVVK